MQATRVIVVGAGASGAMAAGVAGSRGCAVTLLDRNRFIGRKVRIAGKGRCNVTNDTDVRGLEANIPGNPKFLRTAFYHFTPKDTVAFFAALGVPCKTERGGRVFPESDSADDVADALAHFCADNGVTFHHETTVAGVRVADGRVSGVALASGAVLEADAVILATGGSSYPGTGSRGDGYRWAAALGHTIIPVRPSLVPLETVEAWPAEAQGLALKNVALTACGPDGKKRYHEQGEMLFTHFGVSGPLVLSASRHASEPGCTLSIDLKPALDDKALDARVLRDFEAQHRKQYANALGDLLPRSLIPIVVRLSGIALETPVHAITREQRLLLVRLLKGLPLAVKGARPWTEAIVTAGGVSTAEIDPRTLQSRLVPGLYFTGEVIDVDAYTGGFNLQIAWSTGHLAGEHVCETPST
jgi:predicted Rossmann fold flavoprotein